METNVSEHLIPQEVAVLLRNSVNTLYKWRKIGRGPAFVKLSDGAIRYRRSDLDEFIEARVRLRESGPRRKRRNLKRESGKREARA
jgi:predicted DNA-binding transcriptional regulator AlpA